MELISSTRNPRVAEAAKLHRTRERKATGRTLIEGPHTILEALDAGLQLDALFTLDATSEVAQQAAEAGVAVSQVTEAVLERVAGTNRPRGPLATLAVPQPRMLERRDTVVMVDIADPGNAGTLIRTAAAFGFQVAVAGATADPWAPKVIRAGAGGHFRIPIVTLYDPLAELHAAGLHRIALVPGGHSQSTAMSHGASVALLVGSEAHGLPEHLVTGADAVVTLSMPGGLESLNAAVAASIAMYERLRLVS